MTVKTKGGRLPEPPNADRRNANPDRNVTCRARHVKVLAVCLTLALGGCTSATVITACNPPSELMVTPAKPRQLPERVTPLREAVQMWAMDRADAANLAARMAALQAWVKTRCRAE